jgi:hypothetical protein
VFGNGWLVSSSFESLFGSLMSQALCWECVSWLGYFSLFLFGHFGSVSLFLAGCPYLPKSMPDAFHGWHDVVA